MNNERETVKKIHWRSETHAADAFKIGVKSYNKKWDVVKAVRKMTKYAELNGVNDEHWAEILIMFGKYIERKNRV